MSIFIAVLLLSTPVEPKNGSDLSSPCTREADGFAMAATDWLSIICESRNVDRQPIQAKAADAATSMAQREGLRRRAGARGPFAPK